MRRLLQAFTATSIPTGTFLLLLGMGSLGAAPSLAGSVSHAEIEEAPELWASLNLAELPPPAQAAAPPAPEAVEEPAEGRAAEPEAAAPTVDTPEQPQVAHRPKALSSQGRRTPGPKAEALPEPAAAPAKAPAADGGKRRGTCAEPVDSIVKTGSGSWSVERSLVQHYAKDREAASKLAVLVWHKGKDGQVDGFRVRRLRCGSPLHQAGFRNGDVIHAVNGKPITTLAEAAWAYGLLRNEAKLRVKLTRKDGSAQKLRYHLK